MLRVHPRVLGQESLHDWATRRHLPSIRQRTWRKFLYRFLYYYRELFSVLSADTF
jgi:hypothetical protein